MIHVTGKFRKQHDDQWIELSLITSRALSVYLIVCQKYVCQETFATDEEEEKPIESKNIFDDFDSQESQSLLIPEGD